MVGVVNLRRLVAQRAGGVGHAALEGVIAVGIEDIVLAVILVLHYRIQPLELLLEGAACGLARLLKLAVGVGTRIHIGLG